MENDKIKELSKKTIKILEKTKKNYKMYEKERKELYGYFVRKSDVEEWESYINKFEEVINEKIENIKYDNQTKRGEDK